MIYEIDYELTLVETIRVYFEDLELETGSEMKLEVIVPNESCPSAKLLSNTRLSDPESHEDVRKLIVGQDSKNTKKLRHGLLECEENNVNNVLTWEDQYRNCTV